MKFDPGIHRRQSMRLQGYDYSQVGAYFVTICVQNRACLFGEVVNGEMRLNNAGLMIARWYSELENKFPDIECDQFACMPNHVHFIAVNVGADLRVRPDSMAEYNEGEHTGSPLPAVVQWFKTMTTNEYIRGAKQYAWTPFYGKLWQRNYYEHVVRDEGDLARIRDYILNNPARWKEDDLHPAKDRAAQ